MIRVARLPRIHTAMSEKMLEMLKGTPLLDANDRAVLDENGRPIYLPPSAAVLREIRTFLKDNGIDQEPVEGSAVVEVAKQIQQFDDEPLVLEESELPEIDSEGSQEPS